MAQRESADRDSAKEALEFGDLCKKTAAAADALQEARSKWAEVAAKKGIYTVKGKFETYQKAKSDYLAAVSRL